PGARNIGGGGAWGFKGLRLDDPPRALWYTPHHASSYALGLLVMPIAIAAGVQASASAVLMAGCALGASTALNPLVGAVFCGVYALAITIDFLRRQGPLRGPLRPG